MQTSSRNTQDPVRKQFFHTYIVLSYRLPQIRPYTKRHRSLYLAYLPFTHLRITKSHRIPRVSKAWKSGNSVRKCLHLNKYLQYIYSIIYIIRYKIGQATRTSVLPDGGKTISSCPTHFIFQALKCTYQGLKCIYQSLKCTFQGLEYKFPRASGKLFHGKHKLIHGRGPWRLPTYQKIRIAPLTGCNADIIYNKVKD